jgi:hypothetical protein
MTEGQMEVRVIKAQKAVAIARRTMYVSSF